MELLIDSGNSRLKWALLDHGVLQPGGSCDGGASLTADRLDQIWGGLPAPRRVWVANVAGQETCAVLKSWVEAHWQVSPSFVCAKAEGFGVINGYREPARLGVDRWLALVAARHHYPLPACIIDCGTALTLDVIDAKGRHQGGLICPGLDLMRLSLDQGTAAVKVDACQPESGLLGDSTAAAVTLGAQKALLGLVERSVRELNERWSSLHLILTGGGATWLASCLSLPVHLAPDLVLKGLAVVSRNP